MSLSEPLQVALLVARALESIGVEYFLGGSMASSIQGQARFTRDIDFVVRLSELQVPSLVEALGPDFDVDDVALARAARGKTSWNIFHSPTVIRIDLFVLKAAPFDLEEFARRQKLEVAPGQTLSVKSPEDTVLRKLLWYREGGEVSALQFGDVVEVLRTQGDRLDSEYLRRWASTLDLEALLKRASEAAGRAG